MFDSLVEKFPNDMKSLIARIEADSGMNSKDVFRFQDLPAELRIYIYEFALTADRPLRISYHRDNKATQAAWDRYYAALGNRKRKSGLHKLSTVYSITASPAKDGTSKKKPISFAQFCAPALLRASKAIHSEAHPVLYASNRFVFETTSALLRFAKSTSSAMSMLTKVEVRSVSDVDAQLLVPALQAKKITRVVITFKERHVTWIKGAARNLGIALQKCALVESFHRSDCEFHEKKETCNCDLSELIEQRMSTLVLKTRRDRLEPDDGTAKSDMSTEENQEWFKKEVRGLLDERGILGLAFRMRSGSPASTQDLRATID